MVKQRFLIIDSNSVIHRAFHALPPLSNKKGELLNAVYGFLLVFLKSLKDFNPDFVIAAFDLPGKTFRHKEFEEYKATRPPTHKDLISQFPKVKQALKTFGVKIFEKEGFEADDIIGAITERIGKNPEMEIIIVSGDTDILQLVNNYVKVYFLKKGVKDIVLCGEKETKDKYGITPKQISDFKGLRGDSSDNIPGIKGIGEKTAKSLIQKFQNIENLYKALEEKEMNVKNLSNSLKEKILGSKKIAFLSKKLAEIKKNVPIDFSLKECAFDGYDKDKVIEVLEEFEFYSLIRRLSAEEQQPIKENLKLW